MSTLADASANGYDATSFGGVLLDQAGPGDLRALTYDGVDGYTSHTTLGTWGQSMATVEFWIKTSTSAKGHVFGFFNTGSTTCYQFGINQTRTGATSAGNHWLYARDDDGNDVGFEIASSTLRDGNWHHVAIRLDPVARTATFRLDKADVTASEGSTAGGSSSLSSLSNIEFPLTFGARNVRGTPGEFVAVSLAGVAVYDTTLSDAELDVHYDAVI